MDICRISSSPEIFYNHRWITESESGSVVFTEYERRVTSIENNPKTLPILPLIYGTDFSVALTLCSTGFTSISTTDCGYLGKGIYFSSNSVYALSLSSGRKDPAAIIAFVTLGNCYPVTPESGNLVGQSLKSGYNSHYSLVGKNGKMSITKFLHDEIVVMQENQITPVFVLRFNPEFQNHC
eukprot:TRINITY_DN10161_c0_g1_i2.p1 TRINITY_DN10161_c0_g1~~TRINITY_DN10161_c0_g1_i2.p1  ORF type:complete len:181 (-),score=29.55 TRINITY_DN10161_c0_g1_i2:176-718(-)